ncbi:MAG: GWxTD domain-containing protein [Bacteroidales bacterium]|jgi:GWxTD domain-containing protein|nr:GWxTD domain-containing protein [Bacteroidales bacterium]
MKLHVYKFFWVITLILIPVFSFGQKFKVNFNYLLFHIPNETSYIELQFLFDKTGLEYKTTDEGTYYALIGVNISFTHSDTAIKREYTFTSDKYTDSLSFDNIYNVVRIPLPEGKYQMEISLYDKNASNPDTLSYKDLLDIHYNRNIIGLSDIMQIGFFSQATKSDNFTKHGIEYMPYFSKYYPENVKQLTFLTEIYHTDSVISGKDFVIHSYISRYDENTPISPQYDRWEAAKKTDMYVVFQSFKIDSLPSGNYHLNIEVRDRKDTLHASTSLFFQRSNPLVQTIEEARTDSLPYDTLKLYLDYIYIIADNEEKSFIDNISPEKYNEIEEFFNYFWYKRNKENPSEAWYRYYNQVMRVNYNYSTLNYKGYKTDRGYYYLKYGPPTDIEYEHSDVNGPPYEIWTYNVLSDGQVDVMFVFYNVDLTTKDFRLLHSTARGEFRNEKWKEILYIKEGFDKGEIEMYKDE